MSDQARGALPSASGAIVRSYARRSETRRSTAFALLTFATLLAENERLKAENARLLPFTHRT